MAASRLVRALVLIGIAASSALIAIPAGAAEPEPSLPDLTVRDVETVPAPPRVGQPARLRALVANVGTAAAPAGVEVFFHGSGYTQGTARTSAALPPGASVWVPLTSGSATTNDSLLGTTNGTFAYSGAWSRSTGSASKHRGDDHYSSTKGASYLHRFSGSRVVLYGTKAPHHGQATVSLDGGTPVTVDLYRSARLDNTVVWASPRLPEGNHTVRVVVKGTKSAASKGYTITVDRAVTTTSTWTAARTGHTPMYVAVDPRDLIPEISDRDDNLYEGGVRVVAAGPMPDLVVDTLTAAPAAPRVGSAVQFTGRVRNRGTATAPAGVRVAFQVNGSTTTWGTLPAPLAPGASVSVPASSGSATTNDSLTGTTNGTFAYSGAWSRSTGSASKHRGDDHYSSSRGASYLYRFSGSRVVLYGTKAPHHGQASVSLDGGTPVTVDLYRSARLDNTVVWASPRLPEGNHTVRVVVKGTRNAASTGYTVTVDRAVATTRTWTPIATDEYRAYGLVDDLDALSELDESNNAAFLTLTVTSATPLPDLVVTSLSWSPSAPRTGSGVRFTGVVRNQGTARAQAGTRVAFQVAGSATWGTLPADLAPGASVSVPASSGSATTNDSLTGTTNGTFAYSGGWSRSTGSASKHGGDDHYASTKGASYLYRFSGSRVVLYGTKAPHHGQATVSLDGGTPVTVDLYRSARLDNTVVWASPTLPEGNHSVKVVVKGTKSTAATGYTITVDRAVTTTRTWTPTGAGQHDVKAVADDVRKVVESNEINNIFYYPGLDVI